MLGKLLLNVALLSTIVTVSYGDSDEYLSASLNYRLPDKVAEPLHYDIKITVNFTQYDCNFNGESFVLINIKYRTRNIYLHAYKLFINENRTMLCQYGDSIKYKPREHNYNDKTQILRLEFDEEITPGPYKLYMTFNGGITNETIGFFKITYPDTSESVTSIFTTQMKPTGARRVFPCWDEPAFKTTFRISITHPRNYTALSNMLLQSRRSDNDTSHTHFAIARQISTCQLAIIITDTPSATSYQSDVIWHRSQIAHEIDHSRVGFQRGALDFLSTLNINNHVMMKKMDYIAVPNLPDKDMMDLGLSVYREEYYTNNKNLISVSDNVELSILTTTKLIYQWIWNMVSPSWWTHLWLTKTLIMFFQQLILNKLYVDHKMRGFFVFRIQELAFNNDFTSDIRSYENEVNTPDEINKLHSSSCCMKETVLMRMLENVITEDVFRNGVAKYFDTHQFTSVTVDDFWIALQTALNESTVPHDIYNVKDMMDGWFMQRYYPIVKVTRNYTTSDIILMQESDAKENHGNNTKWWIPITYITQSNLKLRKNMLSISWLRSPDYVITLKEIDPNDWIIVNWQYTGYYRVNYDTMSWLRIIDYLNTEEYENIPELNRAHLLDDAFYFLMQNQLNSYVFVLLVNYLRHEEYYAPWYAINKIVSNLWDMSVFKTSESYIIQMYISKVMNACISRLGYEENKYEEDSVKLERLIAIQWACRFENAECRHAAAVKLRTHLQNPEKNTILPWWKDWTYCAGLMAADISLWNDVFSRYAFTRDKDLLIYLTCSEDTTIINHYLELFVTGHDETIKDIRLNSSDHRRIFMSILEKHAGKYDVMVYIMEHIKQIIPSDMTVKEGCTHMLNNIYSIKYLYMVRDFIMSYFYMHLTLDELDEIIINHWSKYKPRIKLLSQMKNAMEEIMSEINDQTISNNINVKYKHELHHFEI